MPRVSSSLFEKIPFAFDGPSHQTLGMMRPLCILSNLNRISLDLCYNVVTRIHRFRDFTIVQCFMFNFCSTTEAKVDVVHYSFSTLLSFSYRENPASLLTRLSRLTRPLDLSVSPLGEWTSSLTVSVFDHDLRATPDHSHSLSPFVRVLHALGVKTPEMEVLEVVRDSIF